MKVKKNSKNPLWIFAFFLFYILYLIILNLNFQKTFLNLIVLFILIILYFINKINHRFLIVPIIFILTLIVFKVLIFIVRFDYFKIINNKRNYLLYYFNDLFYYLNFKDILFYFNSFIFSFIIGNILNEFIIIYDSKIKNKRYLKLIIFPKYFIETFYDEILYYKKKFKRLKNIRKIKNKSVEKIIKKDYKKYLKVINEIVNFLNIIIKKTYNLWVQN